MPVHDTRPASAAALRGFPPRDLALLDDPLEYLHADHQRQRAVCAALRTFAAQGFAPCREAARVTAFLTEDWPLHHADEDLDLHPVLLRRAAAADDLAPVLARIDEDHRQCEPMMKTIIRGLSGQPVKGHVPLDTGTCGVMQVYALSECSHLAVENGVVLAIARIRLTRADIRSISHNMKARRGLKAA